MTPDYSTISRVHFQGKNSEVKTPLYLDLYTLMRLIEYKLFLYQTTL